MATTEHRAADSEPRKAKNEQRPATSDQQPDEAEASVPVVDQPVREYKEINYEGYQFKTLFTRKFENRKPYSMPDPNKLVSFIPGTIMKVFVKDRQKVKKGDKLLVLQAMKMNNIILSPFNGSVKKVYVKTGEAVPKDHLLIELK